LTEKQKSCHGAAALLVIFAWKDLIVQQHFVAGESNYAEHSDTEQREAGRFGRVADLDVRLLHSLTFIVGS
jgi:hypothetical protein